MRFRKLSVLLLVLVCSVTASAAKKKIPKKEGVPTVTAVSPLAVPVGTITIHIVGVKLDRATAILFGDPDVHATTRPAGTGPESPRRDVPWARIIDQDKVEVPRGLDASELGDTILNAELAIPKEWPEGELPMYLKMPDGSHLEFRLLVMKAASLVDEKESSLGFREAQGVQSGQWIRGTVRAAGDVAVFRISGKKGQTFTAEVVAHRRHSLLDSLLILYDGHRNFLAENDDANDTDSLIRCVLPADGDYFLSLTDAVDHGGEGYPYLLSISLTD